MADIEHSQTPQSGIQDTCRLNTGGGQTAEATQQDSYRPLCVGQSESTKGGKFFDSTDGKCSTASAQNYDEQIEREVAENIIDWWISKKSYKEWYAQKFLQLKINFDEEE